jgi:hypothetical protein
MNRKEAAKYLAVFATMFALLAAAPAYAQKPPFAKAYPALITAAGELVLKSFPDGNVSDVTIDTNITSIVPSVILPGEYANVEFHGFAIATREHGEEPALIRFEGLLIVNRTNFWVKFVVEKPNDVPEGKYSANGGLDIAISQITLPPAKITMVMMKGNVTKFGQQDAFGFLEALAKIGTNNFTKVHTTFALQPPPKEAEAPKNFSISFYMVTLANATKTEIDYDNKALYIEGLWNVYNRTVTVTVVDHAEYTTVINIRPIKEGVPGQFNVTLTPQPSTIAEEKWKNRGNFTLQIQGIDTIKGDVIFFQAKFADPSEPGIPRSDFNQDHVVNILDIGQIAKAFGTKLGTPRYEPDFDANSDYVIDIYDIVSAAQEFGQEY